MQTSNVRFLNPSEQSGTAGEHNAASVQSESLRCFQLAHLGCFGAFADLPALDLVLACCEEIDELDRPEAGGDDLWQGARCLILQIQTKKSCKMTTTFTTR